MDSQSKILIAIISIVIILFVILGLKIAGVFESNEKSIEISKTSSYINNLNNGITKNERTALDVNQYQNTDLENYDELTDKANKIIKVSLTFSIIFSMLSVIILFGEARIYQKLGLAEWMVKFTYCYPFINIILSFISINLISFIINLIFLYISCFYFEGIGMSKKWPLYIIIVGLLAIFVGIFSRGLLTAGLIITIITTLVIYSISNYRLGEMFDKSIGFKVGLVLLPFIFRPILGFQRD